MQRERFDELVRRALAELPGPIAERMSNIDVETQEWPSERQLRSTGIPAGHTLLGLYVGVPLTRRSSGYQMVPPDRIIIFQGPLERLSESEDALVKRVRDTVVHEVAHHFGISDRRLDEIESEREERT